MKTLLIPIPYRVLLTTVVSAADGHHTAADSFGQLVVVSPRNAKLGQRPISPTQPVATLPFTIATWLYS